MKKLLSVLAILALVFSLVACGNNKNDTKNNTENNEVTNKQDVIENVENPIKEEKFYSVDEVNNYSMFQFVRLVENPTTGYQWQYVIGDEKIAVVESDEYVPNQSEEGWVGVGGEHTYRLSGISMGETTITFKYIRPWDIEQTAAEEVTFKLKVNDKNEILIISEE